MYGWPVRVSAGGTCGVGCMRGDPPSVVGLGVALVDGMEALWGGTLGGTWWSGRLGSTVGGTLGGAWGSVLCCSLGSCTVVRVGLVDG